MAMGLVFVFYHRNYLDDVSSVTSAPFGLDLDRVTEVIPDLARQNEISRDELDTSYTGYV